MLIGDEVDVVLMESSLALPVLAREPRLELVATLPEVEQYGMAVPPGSDLRAALDTFLASTRNGRSFYQLVLRYLGEHGVALLRGRARRSRRGEGWGYPTTSPRSAAITRGSQRPTRVSWSSTDSASGEVRLSRYERLLVSAS